MTITTALDNPYWDAVKDHVTDNPIWGGREVGDLAHVEVFRLRHELTDRYAWSITAPETVAFVAEYSQGRIVDPIAGSGYWAWM